MLLAFLGLWCHLGISLGLVSGGCSLFAVLRLLIEVASLVAKHQALGLVGFTSCSFQGLEHRLSKLWCVCWVSPWHVGSSQIRDRTHVSCIVRCIQYHWATREAQSCGLLNDLYGNGIISFSGNPGVTQSFANLLKCMLKMISIVFNILAILCLCSGKKDVYNHSISSVQFSRSVVSDSLRSHGLQHARPPCVSPTPRACSDSCPLGRYYSLG